MGIVNVTQKNWGWPTKMSLPSPLPPMNLHPLQRAASDRLSTVMASHHVTSGSSRDLQNVLKKKPRDFWVGLLVGCCWVRWHGFFFCWMFFFFFKLTFHNRKVANLGSSPDHRGPHLRVGPPGAPRHRSTSVGKARPSRRYLTVSQDGLLWKQGRIHYFMSSGQRNLWLKVEFGGQMQVNKKMGPIKGAISEQRLIQVTHQWSMLIQRLQKTELNISDSIRISEILGWDNFPCSASNPAWFFASKKSGFGVSFEMLCCWRSPGSTKTKIKSAQEGDSAWVSFPILQ